MLLGDAAQPRAHAHELQQAVHPVGYSHVGKPDLRGSREKKKKKNTTKNKRKSQKQGPRQKHKGGEWKTVRQELESPEKQEEREQNTDDRQY